MALDIVSRFGYPNPQKGYKNSPIYGAVGLVIKITRQADYGIILMTHLAVSRALLFTARDLAGEVGLPLPTVSKILKQLCRAGVLDSYRGVKGGYRLSRAPESISVAEVIDALDGPVGITECVDAERSECTLAPGCRVKSNWRLINDAIATVLKGISLSEMVSPMASPRLAAPGGGAIEPRPAGLVRRCQTCEVNAS
ncbi:MAG: SUF system Fe-S cluster assembly regulator [Candidatus Schekmanbacteria bacterium]|nr:SUF system Fe-S cluster assembly regulator [Candidatus Schekmanbacteria bacterium]